jgi:DNA-binding beta-propeller fold protein YncE
MTGPSFCWAALGTGLLCLAAAADPARAAPEHFGTPRGTLAGLRDPRAVAFAPDGRVWVADTGHHRILVFDGRGERVAEHGRRGSGPGELLRPAGLACGADGRVYVADTGNHRVQVLGSDGEWLASFGERGRGRGQLCEPRGLAVDARRLLVADSGNARVAVFDHEGAPLDALDLEPGMRRPVGLALDPLARVYVVDELGCTVLRHDPTGGSTWRLGERGAQLGLFAAPGGLAFLGARLFVADRYNHRVQEFDLAGTFVAGFPGPAFAPHGSPGALFAPAGLAASPDGTLLAVCEPLEDRVQLFGQEADGSEQRSHDTHPGIDESLGRVGMGAAGDGTLVAWVDPETRSVAVFADGEIGLLALTRLGARGGMGVALEEPRDVALDKQRGWIHVSDVGRIWTFALGEKAAERGFDPLAARVVRYVELSGAESGGPLAGLAWPCEPGALLVLPDGGLLAADERNGVLLRFDARGAVAELWSAPGGVELRRPVELVLAGERLFVSDADLGRVLELDMRGALVAQFAAPGEGGLRTPSGVLPLADGRVLVADRESDCVHVFAAGGGRVAVWGESGGGPAQLRQPGALLAAPEGLLRLIDLGNRRGQVLTDSGRFVLSF